MSINQQRIEARAPLLVDDLKERTQLREKEKEKEKEFDDSTMTELRELYNRIHPVRGSTLLGFTETLGPIRSNPAPDEIVSFWVKKLNEWMQRDITIRNENVTNVTYNGEPLFTSNITIQGVDIFNNYPEYKRIQLDKNGFVIVPKFDAPSVMEFAKKIKDRDRRDKRSVEEYFDLLKRAFILRKKQIILAKKELDGISEVPEEIEVLSQPFMGPIFPDENRTARVVEPERPKQIGINTEINARINLIKSMKNYPENSNLENYLLLGIDILREGDVNEIWTELKNTIGNDAKFNELMENVNFTEEKTFFSSKKFRDTKNLFMNEKRQIIKRRLLGLLILISRNSNKSTEKKLNNDITQVFFNFPLVNPGSALSPTQDISREIKNVFLNFIRTSGIITEKYLKNVINGDFMNKIYNNEKFVRGRTIESLIEENGDEELMNKARKIAVNKEVEKSAILNKRDKEEKNAFPLSEMLIRIKTKLWLTDDETNRIALSYIFDKYTEEDKKSIMREKEICNEIVSLTQELGKYPIPNLRMPVSIFTSNDEKMQDASYFLEKSGPNILKEIQKDRARRTYRERSASRSGGGKYTRRKNARKALRV
jgi:hypothetical protein